MTEQSSTPAPIETAPKGPSNLLMRVATALVAVPLILLLLFKAPAWALFALIWPAATLGAFELFSMTHADDRGGRTLGTLLGAAVPPLLYFNAGDARVLITLLVVLPLAGPMLTLLRLGDVKTAALRAAALGFGPLYIAGPLTLVALLQLDHPRGFEGPGYVLLCLVFSWLSDTGGYFAGRFLGKHKLYPAVSPKKTVEGAVGGVVAAIVGGFIVRAICLPEMPVLHCVLLGGVASALGQAGDLAESLLKRSVGIKDSGALIPGHGGILDRLDATLLTATTVYLYSIWFAPLATG